MCTTDGCSLLTYMYGCERIDYIFTTTTLAELAIKGGNHQLHQHIISDYKEVYLHFNAKDLFDINTFDKSHASYRRLWMGHRDIVETCITRLERL